MAWFQKLGCWLGIHNLAHFGKFSYCLRRDCWHVRYWPGSGYWDLDIVDTRYCYDWEEV